MRTNDIIGYTLFDSVIEFKSNDYMIGVRTRNTRTLFYKKSNGAIYWIHCDDFVFGRCGKVIMYLTNNKLYECSILQDSSLVKLLDGIYVSKLGNLKRIYYINDRFAVLKTKRTNQHYLFDVKNRTTVDCLQQSADYKFLYFGKLFAVLANSNTYQILGFI